MSENNQIKVVGATNGQTLTVHVSHYLKYPDAFKELADSEKSKVDAWTPKNGKVEAKTQVTQEKATADSKLADAHEKATPKKAAPKVV